jgi:hypothetical protein
MKMVVQTESYLAVMKGVLSAVKKAVEMVDCLVVLGLRMVLKLVEM